ncbi:hypothetical protein M408DRAFT_18848 [Serendipita vermifera MAFF 305830]|uniref:Uncharacterized protein n=1 Tax=Serendipita vermifera MAFF 305830 TaxID=933852 RepID=A0A0C2XYB1_SERVB|nr:hypothetical protein M408DRAFT_18848 [Serendipita vermifera MAFF 305830]
MPKKVTSRRSAPGSSRVQRLGGVAGVGCTTLETVELTKLIQELTIDGSSKVPFEGTESAHSLADAVIPNTRSSRRRDNVPLSARIRDQNRDYVRARAPSPEAPRRSRPYERPAPSTQARGRSPRVKRTTPRVPRSIEPAGQRFDEPLRIPEPPWATQPALPALPTVEILVSELASLRFDHAPAPTPAPTAPHCAGPSSPVSDYSSEYLPAASLGEEAPEGSYDMSGLEEALEDCLQVAEGASSPEADYPAPWGNSRTARGRTWNGGDPSLSPYAPPELYGRVKRTKAAKKGDIPYSTDKTVRTKKRKVRAEEHTHTPVLVSQPVFTHFIPIGVTIELDAPVLSGVNTSPYEYPASDHSLYGPGFSYSQYPDHGY